MAGVRKMREAVPVLIKLTEPAGGTTMSPTQRNYLAEHAADALRSIGDPRAIPAFVRLLTSEELRVRTSAAAGILAAGRYDPRISDVKKEIEKLADSPRWPGRGKAVRLCMKFGDAWARDLLAKLSKDRVPWVRGDALPAPALRGRE